MYAIPNIYRLLINRTDNKYYLYIGINPKLAEREYGGEETTKVLINRKEMKEVVKNGKFEQLAALGLLNIVSTLCEMDIWETDIVELYSAIDRELRRV